MPKKEELLQIDARLVDLLKSSDPIRSGELWRSLQTTFDEMLCVEKGSRGKRVPELLDKLRTLHEECKEDMNYWDKVFEAMDKRDTLIGRKVDKAKEA